jgi:hypothetical protein
LGLIIVVAIGYSKFSRHREERVIANQQVLREKQRLAQQQERAQREAQERERRVQFDRLRQLGVRAVSINAAAADPFRQLGTWLKVTSEPESAEVFFDWARLGTTPLWLNSANLTGLLVVLKEERTAWFSDITNTNDHALTAKLLPRNRDVTSPRLVLVPISEIAKDAMPQLRAGLLRYGLNTIKVNDTDEFLRLERDAGGLTNRAFRAWTSVKYGGDFLLRTAVHEQSRSLDVQSSALAGSVKVFVDIELDFYDLSTGDHLAHLAASESAFATHQARGFDEALNAAVRRAGHELQEMLKK